MMTPSEPSEVEPTEKHIVESYPLQSNGEKIVSALDDALESVTHVVANTVTNSLLAGASLFVGTQVGLRAGVWMQPRPMPHRQAALLEHPMRLRYRNPSELLGQIGVFDGTVVADLGCGTGLFTEGMAQRVGDRGQVHAVDIQAQMIAHTQER